MFQCTIRIFSPQKCAKGIVGNTFHRYQLLKYVVLNCKFYSVLVIEYDSSTIVKIGPRTRKLETVPFSFWITDRAMEIYRN